MCLPCFGQMLPHLKYEEEDPARFPSTTAQHCSAMGSSVTRLRASSDGGDMSCSECGSVLIGQFPKSISELAHRVMQVPPIAAGAAAGGRVDRPTCARSDPSW